MTKKGIFVTSRKKLATLFNANFCYFIIFLISFFSSKIAKGKTDDFATRAKNSWARS